MRVGLVQVNMGLAWSASAHRQGEEHEVGLLPYSAALLSAYARRHAAEAHEFLVPIHGRLPVDEAVARLRGADLVGFSAYVWNVRVSLAIAARLKADRPETVVVFGGPQVPDRPERFLREHPYVDVACHGEGEATFTRLLDAAGARAWDEVPGCSHRDGDRVVTHPRLPRIAQLDEIPSPFLTGEFDALLARHPGSDWVAIWETNRGCPFSCSFCDWGSATASKVYRFGMDRLMAELDWMSERRIGFVFCCDANFGMLKRDIEIAEAVVARKERTGFPFSFSVQNTKNAVERGYRVQKLLNQSLNAYGATISIQSNSPDTLRNINRANISSEAFAELQRRFARDGVYTYTDIIIGLPGESYATFANGVSAVIAGGQHNHIQFHNCSVLPNAEMGDPEYQARFGMRTVAQPIRNLHGAVEEPPEVEEHLDLVVATDAMPAADWRRAKVFAWLTDLYYFDRVLQIPFAVLGARHGLTARDLIEALVAADAGACPTLASVHRMMAAHARAIQQGGIEYLPAHEWGGLLWPADQYALLTLIDTGELDAFYAEAEAVLEARLRAAGGEADVLVLRDAVALNRALLKRPFQTTDARVVIAHRLLEHYQALLRNEPDPPPLREQLAMYTVDRTSRRWATMDAYCEHLTWCQSKDKRGYLYGVRAPRRRAQSAGRREPSTNSPTVLSA